MTEQPTITSDQVSALYDADVVSESDGKIGGVGQVYLDDTTGEPSWVTVKTGLFGGAENFVPLTQASLSGDEIRVPYSKDQVKDAPRLEPDTDLSPEEEGRLYDHYGLSGGTTQTGERSGDVTQTVGTDESTSRVGDRTGTDVASGTGRADAAAATGLAGTTGRADVADETRSESRSQGHDTSGPTTDDAMTRSEEQVKVGTRSQESGRARLRKHIVTERQTTSVPVSHDEVRVEREPITDANRDAAGSGAELTEEEHEVTLNEERPVVEKETVAVERVRLGTEEVTEQQQVSSDVSHEEIEVDEGTTRDER